MPTPTAAEIIAKCAERYATCRTYQDTGEVRTVFVDGPRPWERRTVRRPFRTYFQRPSLFFIEYKDMGVGPESEWGHAVVWQNEFGVQEWSTRPFPFERDSPRELHDALGALMGVSGGSSGFTPWLLTPHQQYSPLPDPTTAELVNEEPIDGHVCYRVRGRVRRVPVLDVWIDCNELLVRRKEQGTKFDATTHKEMDEGLRKHVATLKPDDPKRVMIEKSMAERSQDRRDFTTEERTALAGTFDAPIDPRVFEFVPPG